MRAMILGLAHLSLPEFEPSIILGILVALIFGTICN